MRLGDQVEHLAHAALGVELELDRLLLLVEVGVDLGRDHEVHAGDALQVGRDVGQGRAAALGRLEARGEADRVEPVEHALLVGRRAGVEAGELERLALADFLPALGVVEDQRVVLRHVHRVDFFDRAQPLLAVVLARGLLDLGVARVARDLAQLLGRLVGRLDQQDLVAVALGLVELLVQEGAVGVLVQRAQHVLAVVLLLGLALLLLGARGLLGLALLLAGRLLRHVHGALELARDDLLVQRVGRDQRVVAQDHLRLAEVVDGRVEVARAQRVLAGDLLLLGRHARLGAAHHRLAGRVLDQLGRVGVAVAQQRAHGVQLVARGLARGIELQRRGEGFECGTEVTALELGLAALQVVVRERPALFLAPLLLLCVVAEGRLRSRLLRLRLRGTLRDCGLLRSGLGIGRCRLLCRVRVARAGERRQEREDNLPQLHGFEGLA